jgi:integrase
MDLERGSIHVSETMYKLNGEIIKGPPKTSASRRVVYLPPFLVASLMDHRQKAIEQRKGMKARLKGEDLVFADPEGNPFDPSTLSHAFKHLVEKAGLKDIRLHDLRHSYASLLLKSGKHPMIVSAQLGHASIRTTLDTYSHLLPGLQEEAVKDLDVYRPKQLPGPDFEKR